LNGLIIQMIKYFLFEIKNKFWNDEKMKADNKQKRRRDGLERQAEIMAVALDMFAEKGCHATTVDDIIKKKILPRVHFICIIRAHSPNQLTDI